MSKRTIQVTAVSALLLADALCAIPAGAIEAAQLDQLAGQPVDITPWAYLWRADRAVQDKPEAYFIPRRLDRIDTVYRTAKQALSAADLKSLYYEQPDVLATLPPKPVGVLQTGLLWVGRLSEYQIELVWPSDAGEIPAPDSVEVRVYPTSWGWFGWTVDRALAAPEVVDGGKRWIYKSEPGLKMDYAYSRHIDAATEMVAVFYENGKEGTKRAIPTLRVTGSNLGQWKRMDIEIEWGFQDGATKFDFDGRIEAQAALTGPTAALAGDARQGVTLPVLYAPDAPLGLDSRVTVRTKDGGFTFRVRDLETGSILVPGSGVFVIKAGSGQTARQYAAELAAKGLKRVRQKALEHPETASWEKLMQEVRLWTCPDGTALKPFPETEAPAMDVRVSDPGWTSAWRSVSAQLRGKNLWGGLAHEVGRVVHAMDLVGLHAEADNVYDHFLKSPGIKSDGDFVDGAGSLEWAASMRHDIGYSHDGTHASTGRMLFAMTERYFLTGDKAWFERNRPRQQAAADWILRQRKLYMMNTPNRQDLFVAGLMPPCMLGDYALPSCDWHWYYCDNAFALQGVQRFADALTDFDAEAGRRYHAEADAFRQDLRRAVGQEAILSPVRLGQDGAYHQYLPRMAYARGLNGHELMAPQYSDSEMDSYVGALPLAEPFAALDANSPSMIDTLDVMTEMTTSEEAVQTLARQRKAKGLPADDAWYWMSYVSLPKISHNANIFLLQDDVPNFLRFWMNAYATMVGADGKLWEHWHLGGLADCETPDNGTAGWFMENFRNMLVMELGDTLWIARATPRAWLGQGKTIAVKNAPTYFGDVAYEIVSDVDHGRIAATVEMPGRREFQEVVLRLRHPQAKPLKAVSVNGNSWTGYDRDKETIRVHGLTGTVRVEASY